MFNISASWHISETYSSYNEWETLDPTTFKQGLTRLFDMYINPQNHGCDDEWVDDEEGPQYFYTSLNINRGLFLIQEGHDSFTGEDSELWAPLPKCRPAVRRPE